MRLKVKYSYLKKCSYLQIRVEEFRIVFIFFSPFFSGIAVHPMDMVEDEEDSEVDFVKKYVANSPNKLFKFADICISALTSKMGEIIEIISSHAI